MREAVLRTGDQVVFDAHHRFVVEAPGRPTVLHDAMAPALPDDIDFEHSGAKPVRPALGGRRLPWLLLTALAIAGLISALLLFGSPG